MDNHNSMNRNPASSSCETLANPGSYSWGHGGGTSRLADQWQKRRAKPTSRKIKKVTRWSTGCCWRRCCWRQQEFRWWWRRHGLAAEATPLLRTSCGRYHCSPTLTCSCPDDDSSWDCNWVTCWDSWCSAGCSSDACPIGRVNFRWIIHGTFRVIKWTRF